MSEHPPEGIFGDILGLGGIFDNIITDASKILPAPISSAITDVVGKILDPTDPSVSPGDPQPTPAPIPTSDPGVLSDAVKVIDTVLGALTLISKFDFIIPDKYETVLNDLAGALKTVRGWLT